MEEEKLEQEVVVEAPQPQQEAPEQQEERPPQAEAQPYQANAHELNLRDLREAKAKAERENEVLTRRLATFEQPQQQAQPAPQEEDLAIGADDLMEGRHYQALDNRIAQMKKQQEEEQRRYSEALEEGRLNRENADFSKVVNEDTLRVLRDRDPAFAEVISTSTGSLYAKGASLYKRIKELGIYVEDKYQKEKAIAHANASKPVASNSVSPQRGERPLEEAHAYTAGPMTQEEKDREYAEMLKCSRKA